MILRLHNTTKQPNDGLFQTMIKMKKLFLIIVVYKKNSIGHKLSATLEHGIIKLKENYARICELCS